MEGEGRVAEGGGGLDEHFVCAEEMRGGADERKVVAGARHKGWCPLGRTIVPYCMVYRTLRTVPVLYGTTVRYYCTVLHAYHIPHTTFHIPHSIYYCTVHTLPYHRPRPQTPRRPRCLEPSATRSAPAFLACPCRPLARPRPLLLSTERGIRPVCLATAGRMSLVPTIWYSTHLAALPRPPSLPPSPSASADLRRAESGRGKRQTLRVLECPTRTVQYKLARGSCRGSLVAPRVRTTRRPSPWSSWGRHFCGPGGTDAALLSGRPPDPLPTWLFARPGLCVLCMVCGTLYHSVVVWANASSRARLQTPEWSDE